MKKELILLFVVIGLLLVILWSNKKHETKVVTPPAQVVKVKMDRAESKATVQGWEKRIKEHAITHITDSVIIRNIVNNIDSVVYRLEVCQMKDSLIGALKVDVTNLENIVTVQDSVISSQQKSIEKLEKKKRRKNIILGVVGGVAIATATAVILK